MSQAIRKFEIPKGQRVFAIEMPNGAQFRYFSVQGDCPCMWFEVNPGRAISTRQFHLIGTGLEFVNDATRPLNYIGSFQVPVDGSNAFLMLASGAVPQSTFVFHIYEEIQNV